MAILTANGIEFAVGNVLNSKYGIIPQTDSPMLFIQSTAPVGWTRLSINDRCLRVVTASGTGTGGTVGGTNAFSNTFIAQTYSATVPVTITNLSVNNTTIDVNTMVQHSHPLNAGGTSNRNGPNPNQGSSSGTGPSATTGNFGGGLAHNHPVSYTSASGPGSCPVDMRIQYVDCNICSFN